MSLRSIWLCPLFMMAGCSQPSQPWSRAAIELEQRLASAGHEVTAERALDASHLGFVCWIDEGEELRGPVDAGARSLGQVPDGQIGILYRSDAGLAAVIIPRATLLAYQGTQCFDGRARWVRNGEGVWALEGQRLP